MLFTHSVGYSLAGAGVFGRVVEEGYVGGGSRQNCTEQMSSFSAALLGLYPKFQGLQVQVQVPSYLFGKLLPLRPI